MNLGELLRAWRIEVGDKTFPYLYDDDDGIRWANNAQREACIRLRCLQDEVSSKCRIRLIPGVAKYKIDPAILAVRAALYPGRQQPLFRTDTHNLDQRHPGWQHMAQQQAGQIPEYVIFDTGTKTLTLYPPPSAPIATVDPDPPAYLYLRVYRMPYEAERLADESDELVVPMADPESLKYWMAFESFNVKDSELEDQQRADRALALFTGIVGERPNDRAIQSWSVDAPPIRRMQLDY